ncbi:hypothetical protein FB45DRAFT_1057140 [Roridomyces roridus]|uniref:F-box domain-containing protein n=1 Tax=Roridomyces roridus TaxID=1738132 RepID=A0AAD7FSD4_9AGAR|nr:hypothetical protein FB45DRAFT_1057140 [Roridomyces roridus]
MERTLHIPELLDIICAYLVPDKAHLLGRGRGDLAALARTCKTFHDPALDALWRIQFELAPALSLFPEDLWVRFDPPASWSARGFKALQTLVLHCPTSHLFPNLREIQWIGEHSNIAGALNLFSAPRLTCVGATPGESETEIAHLRSLGHGWPELTHLALSTRKPAFSSSILDATFDALGALTRLQSFSGDNIDLKIFNRLSQLPNLKHVEATMVGFECFPDHPSHADPPFSALERLSGTMEPDNLIQILSATSGRPLTSIEIIFDAGSGIPFSTSSTIANVYGPLGTHCVPSSLSTLSIKDEYLWGNTTNTVFPDSPEGYAIGPQTLRLLLPFTNLKSLVLEPYHGFELDDDTLRDMASQAWGQLEELTIAACAPLRCGFDYPPVTLNGVQHLARHCQRLKMLTLLFDASEIPALNEQCVQRTLNELNVSFSAIEDPTEVALFLEALFPTMNSIMARFCVPEDEDESTLWDEVRDHVKAIRRE